MSTLLRSLVALGLSCTLASAPAFAAPDAASEAPQRFVNVADLDLTTRAGQHALHSRILQAADQLCERPAPNDFGPMRDIYMECRNAALISAAPQVQLALARAHGGTSLASNEQKTKPAAP